jgi:ABC-type transport system involved in cytochrome bd biosynthesis fused ATPase/permease subunit
MTDTDYALMIIALGVLIIIPLAAWAVNLAAARIENADIED